jgi:hypothetical protein
MRLPWKKSPVAALATLLAYSRSPAMSAKVHAGSKTEIQTEAVPLKVLTEFVRNSQVLPDEIDSLRNRRFGNLDKVTALGAFTISVIAGSLSLAKATDPRIWRIAFHRAAKSFNKGC